MSEVEGLVGAGVGGSSGVDGGHDVCCGFGAERCPVSQEVGRKVGGRSLEVWLWQLGFKVFVDFANLGVEEVGK